MKICKNCYSVIKKGNYCMAKPCQEIARAIYIAQNRSAVLGRYRDRYLKDKSDPIKYLKMRKINTASQEKRRFGRLKIEILNIYGNKCGYCGKYKKLLIHHIDGNGRNSKKPNNNISNLIPCCKSCHNNIHLNKINLVPMI